MTRIAVFASFALGLALGIGGYAIAQTQGHDHGQGHGNHVAPAQGSAEMPASTRAFVAANDAMHADMMIEFTGDADADFIAGMIPHHEGAIVMAEIVLEHGEDPEVADLARDIIAAQQVEIDWMRAWLAERGH